MRRKNRNSFVLVLLFAIIILVGGVAVFQQFGFVPAGDTVWIPSYATFECARTRLECYPGVDCNLQNPSWHEIDDSGEKFWCGGDHTPLSDSDFYEGCDVHISTSEGFWAFTTFKVCEEDETDCLDADINFESGWFERRGSVHLDYGEMLKINPLFENVDVRLTAHVYGVRVEGAIHPQYSSRCNLASLLNENQISVLQDSPEYIDIINAGELFPSNFPIIVITGYHDSYEDQRVIQLQDGTWFVESIGMRCKIEKDTNNRWVVTDECVPDNDLECFPNTYGCDLWGHIISDPEEPNQQGCVPGTLIGTGTGWTAISATTVCKRRCNDDGIVEQYACKTIPQCTNGEVLNQDYECVDSTRITEKERCEAQDGKYRTYTDSDGNFVEECDFGTGLDPLVLFIILGVVVVVLVMFAVKMKKQKR